MRSTFVKSLIAVCAFAARAVLADSLAIVPPRPLPGPRPVQCSDVAQDITRVDSGWLAKDYWEGVHGYVTDLLTEPGNTPTVLLRVPSDTEMFGSFAGSIVVNALIICAPTSPENPRPDYVLPTGKAVPHMMRAGDAPIWPDATTRYPLLVFSHGLRGSPISSDYVDALAVLASYGYVVVAPFHGDPRFANLSVDDLQDYLNVVLHFHDYIAMQSIRPLAMSAAIDAVLTHPDWMNRVDASRIGAFGASMGGESAMLLAGARLTVSVGLSSRQVIDDRRLSAAVGYVPYFGQPFFPAFGRDQAGVDDVTVPFLAISGTADLTSPIAVTQFAMNRLQGTRELVALQGVGHYFDVASTGDIFTWTLQFFDAYTAGDRAARAQMQRMVQVAGGGADALLLDYNAPAAPIADEAIAVEYYHPLIDHYFVTAYPDEVALLDANVPAFGWQRTGFDFKVWSRGSPTGLPACRFYGRPGVGPNTHVYTIDPAECASLNSIPAWLLEGNAFNAERPVGDECPAGRMEVWRMFNNMKDGTPNHRYVTSHSEVARMSGLGWILEGAALCTPP